MIWPLTRIVVWQRARCLATCEEVSHDRDGVPSERNISATKTAFAHRAGNTDLSITMPQCGIGEPREINANIANKTRSLDRTSSELEHCVRVLAALVGEVERLIDRN